MVEETVVSSAAFVQRRLQLSARIVSAYVAGNQLPVRELPRFIVRIAVSVEDLFQPDRNKTQKLKLMALLRKTVTDDYIVCLEDGRRYRSLKQPLRVHYGMTPEQYRTKWELPDDYPMVAPSLAALRSERARRLGPSRKRKASGRPAGKAV